jgi:hypothetical protein
MDKETSSNKRGYPSNVSGRRIINAETGVPTDHFVGSRDELLYWKVADGSRRNDTGDSDVFFYDSPEQYVRHRFRPMKYYRPNENVRRWEARRDMVRDSESMVLWSLVTRTGENAEEFIDSKKTGILMVPRINPACVSGWQVTKSNYMASVAGTRGMSGDGMSDMESE